MKIFRGEVCRGCMNLCYDSAITFAPDDSFALWLGLFLDVRLPVNLAVDSS